MGCAGSPLADLPVSNVCSIVVWAMPGGKMDRRGLQCNTIVDPDHPNVGQSDK
jgi:hypothetical protein